MKRKDVKDMLVFLLENLGAVPDYDLVSVKQYAAVVKRGCNLRKDMVDHLVRITERARKVLEDRADFAPSRARLAEIDATPAAVTRGTQLTMAFDQWLTVRGA